jgi:hypothetical protein
MTVTIGRRELLAALGGAAVAWPLAASAQQADAARIGVLSPLSASETTSAPFEAFRKALRDLGYIEGKSVNFIYRWADGDHERLAGLAADLAQLQSRRYLFRSGHPDGNRSTERNDGHSDRIRRSRRRGSPGTR